MENTGASRVFTATTPGGDIWASASLAAVDTARDEFGKLVMSLLCKVEDPPLHLDLMELERGDANHHYASVRFDYPGTWEIVEPNAPLQRLAGNRIDTDAYPAGDPKAMQYGRA